MDSLAVARDRPLGQIDDDAVDASLVRRLATARGAASQLDANACAQLVGAERLGDVVVRAELQELDFLTIGVARREDDDRGVAPRADLAADARPIDVRKPQVENDDVRSLR